MKRCCRSDQAAVQITAAASFSGASGVLPLAAAAAATKLPSTTKRGSSRSRIELRQRTGDLKKKKKAATVDREGDHRNRRLDVPASSPKNGSPPASGFGLCVDAGTAGCDCRA
jgi:hypothetical protein